jgi:hypothetical protein
MKYFSFNPFGNESLTIEFNCNECGHQVTSEDIEIPYPDYSADTAKDNQTDEEGFAMCEGCGKEFNISIYSTYAGGDGTIDELPDNHHIDITENPEPYYENQYEAIASNTLFFETFKSEIDNLKELNKITIANASTDKTLRRQIFIGVIASMETYLSDAFINTTLNSKDFTKKFVGTSHDFKERPISLNELFEYHEKIETICKQAMLDVIYHNLPKVKGMYKDTLGVDLGDIGTAYKAVLTRHDLVHRNGKTKDDVEVLIDSVIIDQLISDIETFIGNIDKQIEEKNAPELPDF